MSTAFWIFPAARSQNVGNISVFDRGQFAVDRSLRLQPSRLCCFQQLGHYPHARHYAHGPRRAGVWRLGIDQRSSRLPRNDRRGVRWGDQSQRGDCARGEAAWSSWEAGLSPTTTSFRGSAADRSPPRTSTWAPGRLGELHPDRAEQARSATVFSSVTAWATSARITSVGGQLSANVQYVGYSGTGNFVQAGGTNSISNALYLGANAGGSGAYGLSGSGQLSPDSGVRGLLGHGQLHAVGRHQPRHLSLSGRVPGRIRRLYSLSGGQLLAAYQYSGSSGVGNFIQTGRHNNSSFFYLGYRAGGCGSLLPQRRCCSRPASTSTWAFQAREASRRPAVPTLPTTFCLGGNLGSSGTYSLGGSGRVLASSEDVGPSGTGLLVKSGGTNSVSSYLSLGNNAGGSGTYILSGNGQLSAAAKLLTSTSGTTAAFQQTGGTNTTAQRVDRQQQQLSARRRPLAGEWQPPEPGHFQRRRHAGHSRRQWFAWTSPAGPGRTWAGISLNIGANSLLIVPAGFSPATSFAALQQPGVDPRRQQH